MEKAAPLVLEALSRAVADPGGLPLYTAKQAPGLFAASAASRLAAQRCKDDGLLHVVRTETKGKTAQEICAITEKGLAYLLSQSSPRPVLEGFLRAIETRGAEFQQLHQTAQQLQASLDALRAVAEKLSEHLQKPSANSHAGTNGAEVWLIDVLSFLTERQRGGAIEDCPLPDLYRKAQESSPSLTIGRFHDGLRKLHQQEQIYLHPWTGPLYDVPDPALALLVGHEIAYYASRR
jgi:DNA-binding PadR family transcriptional regulator